MSRDSGYGQFCPVAKTAEIMTTRWTPLILRELICGSIRFNEIHRGVPLMSRGLLAQRLKELEAVSVIERTEKPGVRGGEYRLTEAGEQLKPIVVAMGLWGLRWVEIALESKEWDAGVLMWDVRRRIDISALPRGRTVIGFTFADAPAEMRVWWLVVANGEVDLCQRDPGYRVDLYYHRRRAGHGQGLDRQGQPEARPGLWRNRVARECAAVPLNRILVQARRGRRGRALKRALSSWR